MSAAPSAAAELPGALRPVPIWTRGAALVAAALLAHGAFSAAVAALMDWGYPHRMYDVRRWGIDPKGREARAQLQADLVAPFLARRGSGVLFVGSSFTFGYPWQESVIFTRLVGGTNASVINLELGGIHNIVLCNLGDARPRALVLEIPVVNSLAHPDTPLRCVPASTRSYLGFALAHPIGPDWLRFLWDNEAYPKPDQAISIVQPPPDYFARRFDRDIFFARVATVIGKATPLAERVYAFPSPVYLPGVAQVGYDPQTVRLQLDTALAACRAVPGVVCLDPRDFYDKPEYFYNMTHLNQNGHRAMARWLGSIVR